ncbi:MAG TPA: helix-hairpin-helix domain-containing protein [Candidatus Eisenbacteria bacterium]|nr:helix-hairpin-helix domain-containing protein [Candidatus Eisenbacteria bacterium]
MRRTIPFLSMILLAGAVALAPATSFAAKTKKPTAAAASAKGASTAASAKTAAAANGAPGAAKVDINTASKEDLAKLPVIGDAIAAKIIAGRPYKTKRDLLTKKVLTANQYAKVKDLIIAKK